MHHCCHNSVNVLVNLNWIERRKSFAHSFRAQSCTSGCPLDTCRRSCRRKVWRSDAGCRAPYHRVTVGWVDWERWWCETFRPLGYEWRRLGTIFGRTACGWGWCCDHSFRRPTCRPSTSDVGTASSKIPITITTITIISWLIMHACYSLYERIILLQAFTVTWDLRCLWKKNEIIIKRWNNYRPTFMCIRWNSGMAPFMGCIKRIAILDVPRRL